jgi:hypothetical protein
MAKIFVIDHISSSLLVQLHWRQGRPDSLTLKRKTSSLRILHHYQWKGTAGMPKIAKLRVSKVNVQG